MPSWNNLNVKLDQMRFSLLLLFICTLFISHGKVVLPDVLSDNMVLQQNAYIKLSGISKPNKLVRIRASWNKKEYKYHTKKDGSFKVSIKTPAGGFKKHTLTFDDGQIVCLRNILIGEVWFCSGQSNMEMTFKGFNNQPIEGAAQAINEANSENGIRMLRVKRNAQDQPVKIAEGKWQLSTTQNVPNFSATAYFFALHLRQKLNIPIGIINSSYGGSSVEGWMSRESVEKYTDLDLKQDIPDNETWRKPVVFYNGMLKPYTDYAIKGFLWYQGEANIDRYASYANKLRDMVTLWRNDWKLGKLPFYIVEIAPYLYDDPVDAAKLREAQFNASKLIENSGIICTNDLVHPEESTIVHPSQKRPIGERLANYALFNTYGFDTLCVKSPHFDKMEIINNEAIVYLSDCANGIESSADFTGFEIAGSDSIFHPAKAILTGFNRTFVLQSMEVPTPVAVRFCFKNYAVGNVRNSCGLPLFGFRTDNWEN